MKTIALTFTISSLFLGIVFFAYEASEPQEPQWHTRTRAIAVALGATDLGNSPQETATAMHAANSTLHSDANAMRFANDKD